MRILKEKTLKLKAALISTDGGRTWVVSRQYYLTDLSRQLTNGNTLLLNDNLQGLFLMQMENANDNNSRNDRASAL